jgi:hypothetical protein
MPSRTLIRSLAVGAATIAIGGGAYGIVSATASTSSGAATTLTTTSTTSAPAAGGASNARSGPAAGGTIGKITSVSSSGFDVTTATGGKVTIKETSSTKYEKGSTTASKSAATKGKTVLVVGTDDNTSITATTVIVSPPTPNAKTAAEVIGFSKGTSGSTKTVGTIPADYTQGTGTILSGSTANKATEVALETFPGGVVDRVVQLSNGDFEVHNIGVNWPHHIFVNKDFKVIGAGD